MNEDDELVDPTEEDTDDTITPEEAAVIPIEEPVAEHEDEVVKVLAEIPDVEEVQSPKHKVYPVDPEKLNAPLRPEELWDEDGTI